MRDFSDQNLRGRNFRGQDLRGANFTGADIRGAKFVDAQLQGADFSEAKAGLQRRSMIGQIVIAFTLSIVLNFTSVLLNGALFAYLFQPSTIKQISIVPGIISIIFSLGSLLTLAKQGFTTKALSIVLSLFAVAIAVAVAVAVAVAGAVAGAVAVLALLIGFYGAWRANQGDERFAILRSFGLAFASLGGTSFSGADLTDANFTNAMLKNTNFANSRKQTTNLMRVC